MPDAAQNQEVILYSQSTVTAATLRNTTPLINENAAGLMLVIDITAIDGATTATFTIQGFDGVSGAQFTILASAALAAVATTVLRVYPGLTAAANLTVNDHLPGRWRVKVTGTGTNITYTVTGWYLV